MSNITQEQIEQRKLESKAQREAQKAERKEAKEQFLAPYRKISDEKQAKLGRAQHFHDMYNNRTYAVVPPNSDALRTAAAKLINGGKEVGVIVNVGVSSVNTSTDNYERKVGRLVASSKLEPILMKLDSIRANGNIAKYVLSLDNLVVELVSQDSSKELPMLVFAGQ